MNRSDKIYVYPTDTVWGLGCGIHSEHNAKKIIGIKKKRPFSILFYDLIKTKEYFSFPSCMDDGWLKRFFKLQSAMALPLSFAKQDIPPWVTAGSSFVVIRILPFVGIKAVIEEAQAPIITTSLNFSGEPSIYEKDQAFAFHQKHLPDSRFIDENIPCSGSASTIVAWENGEIKFWRLGEKAGHIHHLCLEILPSKKVHFDRDT